MSIDPKVAMWIKIVLLVLTALTTGTISLNGLVSPATATQIIALASIGVVVLGIVMSAYSSSAPGPLAPADPPAVVAVQKAVDVSKATSSQVAIETAKNDAVAAVQTITRGS